jgi:hypothetical protein
MLSSNGELELSRNMMPVEPKPEAVSDWGRGFPTYWLPSADGNFRPCTLKELRLHGKREGKTLQEIEFRAREFRVEIKPMAGVRPGVYAVEKRHQLEPQYVSFCAPPPAADPPDEFHELANVWLNCKDPSRQRETKEEMVRIYAKVNHAKEYPSLNPWLMLGKKKVPGGFPLDDHGRMFQNDEGFIWTSQPYGYTDYELAEIIGFAHYHGLTINISPNWSWHSPGKTVLLEWRKN